MRLKTEFILFFLATLVFQVKGALANGPGFIEPQCRQQAINPCEPIGGSTCFGVELPYTDTSAELVKFNASQVYIQKQLERWEGLRFSPKCWAVIQPLLCSVYMPKCHDGMIELPSQETCKSARSTCKLVEQDLNGWPEYLKCDDFAKFSSNCKNTEIRELKFNTTTACLDPMIQVDNNLNYYEGFEGCAFKCQDPLYSDENHDYVSKLILYLGICLLVFNGGVVVTFWIKWDPSLESKSVFYANLYWCGSTIVWMFQFLPNAKPDIVCRKDGTIRRDERSPDENVVCVVIFVLMYGLALSALQFLIIFVYNLNRICKPADGTRDRLPERPTHAVIWFFTAVFVIIAVSYGQIGGSSITGTCFPGPMLARVLFIVIPVEAAAIAVIYFLSNSAYHLRKLLSGNFIDDDGRREINCKVFRIIIFSCTLLALAATLIWLQYNEASGRPLWEKSLRESIVCRMNITDTSECIKNDQPGLTPVVIGILLYLLAGVLISSWAWTGASCRRWIRCTSSCCRCGESPNTTNSLTIRRHKLISKAFSKRMQRANGRLTPSAQTTHEDPVGLDKLLSPTIMGRECAEDEQNSRLNFQTNTEGTGDISSSDFAATLPNCATRRGGLIPQHSSCQSEDSRRSSCESMAMAAHKLQGSISNLEEPSKRRSRLSRLKGKLRGRGKHSRSAYCGSSTSMESNTGSKILPAITALIDKKLGRPGINTQVHNQLLPLRKTIIMKELAIQTSFEKLSVLQPAQRNVYTTSNNFAMCDKSTQWSMHNLHEIGTQTKKSATKKKDKERGNDCKKNDPTREVQVANPAEGESNDHDNDAVLKLLCPA